jgi:hypothetical protein
MTAGERLRQRIQAELDENGIELDGRELEFLDRAVAIADSIDALEAVVAKEGPTTKGNRGTITHPALTEIRHLSLALHRLLSSLDLVGKNGQPKAADAATRRGRSAASARWKEARHG